MHVYAYSHVSMYVCQGAWTWVSKELLLRKHADTLFVLSQLDILWRWMPAWLAFRRNASASSDVCNEFRQQMCQAMVCRASSSLVNRYLCYSAPYEPHLLTVYLSEDRRFPSWVLMASSSKATFKKAGLRVVSYSLLSSLCGLKAASIEDPQTLG